MAAGGVTCYVALVDGVIAGGATIRVAGSVAQFGAATAPRHRRRGVQTALLAARFADASAAGCDIAVVTTQPGSKSQQNVQRRGFDLLYRHRGAPQGTLSDRPRTVLDGPNPSTKGDPEQVNEVHLWTAPFWSVPDPQRAFFLPSSAGTRRRYRPERLRRSARHVR